VSNGEDREDNHNHNEQKTAKAHSNRGFLVFFFLVVLFFFFFSFCGLCHFVFFWGAVSENEKKKRGVCGLPGRILQHRKKTRETLVDPKEREAQEEESFFSQIGASSAITVKRIDRRRFRIVRLRSEGAFEQPSGAWSSSKRCVDFRSTCAEITWTTQPGREALDVLLVTGSAFCSGFFHPLGCHPNEKPEKKKPKRMASGVIGRREGCWVDKKDDSSWLFRPGARRFGGTGAGMNPRKARALSNTSESELDYLGALFFRLGTQKGRSSAS